MGIRISALPSIASPALSDIFPVVQNGVTYKETVTQLSTLIGGVVSGSIIGTANQIIVTPGVGNVTLSTPQDIATTSDATFGSIAFSDTTKGIVGTTTNNSAGTGYVGQFISSIIATGSAINIADQTSTDLTSISLTSGDWDVWGNLAAVFTGACKFSSCWTSSVSATPVNIEFQSVTASDGSALTSASPTPYRRFSLSTTTTIYITGFVHFTTGSCSMVGGIYARRAR